MARKTKYTPEIVERITYGIKLGATQALAAAAAGISGSTFYDWLNSKPEFSDAVKRAEGEAAIGWLSKIEAAAMSGNWQAAAWKLERRYPNDYGKRQPVPIIEPKDDDPLGKLSEAIALSSNQLSRIALHTLDEHDLSSLNDDELDTLHALAEKYTTRRKDMRKLSDTELEAIIRGEA